MSLNNLDQKSMLFGNTPMNKEDKKPTPSLTHSTTKKTPPTTTTTKKHTHLSSTMCTKKINEGKEYHEKGLKHLKTSLFQWSADHVAAAATFEAAGNCYHAAGELEKAKELYLLASVSHDNAGAAAASAQALLKASKATKALGDAKATADIHVRSSVMWGVHGDPNRAGEFLLKAAKELHTEDPQRARELYLKGLDHLCPEDTPEDQMSSCPAIVPEAIRQCFDFYMSVRSSSPTAVPGTYTVPTLEIVEFCNRMIRVFSGLEAEASKCRMILTITLLQLELGDVIGADRGFMDKLGDSDYLKSNESALAEDFITAYKNLDCDKLEAAQRSHHLMHLDRSVQNMARGLSLLRGHNAVPNESTNVEEKVPVPIQHDAEKTENSDDQLIVDSLADELNDVVVGHEKEESEELSDEVECGEVLTDSVNNNNDDDDDDDFDLT